MNRFQLTDRRALLSGLGGLGATGLLSACATTAPSIPPLRPSFASKRIAPILMRPERIIRTTVCTRPFRAEGPRIDVERVGDTLVVHNYGHGGSGWSLSWGSSAVAAAKALALAGGPTQIAVIGCGALGLTSALQLQRLGARVVIYARERMPFTRSMRATGTWSPDSRVADAAKVSAGFPDQWERMARDSFATFQTYLGTDGDPVVFSDRYIVNDGQRAPRPPKTASDPEPIAFAHYAPRLRDIIPRSVELPSGSTPFPAPSVRFGTEMQFNVTELAHRLMQEFLQNGGRMEIREFHAPTEIAALPEKVVINCTGYGARALWRDESIIPIRGQIAWLSPQTEVDYGVYYRGVTVLSRPDGIVVQNWGGEMSGYGVEDETPDRAEAEATIALVAPLFPPFTPPATG